MARVIDKWTAFLEQFPDATSCADAGSGAVISLWSGLGYNRRAVNLWRAAVEIRDRHGGSMPDDIVGLQSLPGVGPYTARAVAVFAFEQSHGVVDTNVGRLLARWCGHRLRPADAQATADALVPTDRAWQWNQTLFDFAVAVCTRRDPACDACPLAEACAWVGRGPDPAHRSAGVSSAQSKFEGSERQVRGRILDAVRAAPVPEDELDRFARAQDTPAELARIIDGLVRDGLVQRRLGLVCLPA